MNLKRLRSMIKKMDEIERKLLEGKYVVSGTLSKRLVFEQCYFTKEELKDVVFKYCDFIECQFGGGFKRELVV